MNRTFIAALAPMSRAEAGASNAALRRLSVRRLTMLAAVGAAAVVAQSFAVLADEVPTLDIRKSCKADVQIYDTTGGQASVTRCLSDEQNARATLVGQWAQFSPASKQECVQIQVDGSGPQQSYVELLTCLQMAKEAKSLKD